MKQGSKRFNLGGLHEKHAVATWSLVTTKVAQSERKRLYPTEQLYVNQLVVGEEERWYMTVVSEVNFYEGNHHFLFLVST